MALLLAEKSSALPPFAGLPVVSTPVVRAALVVVCLLWPAAISLQASNSTAEMPAVMPWFDFPDPPAPAVIEPVTVIEVAAEPAVAAAGVPLMPAVPARLKPWADYVIPPPTLVPGLPLRAEVARWQPLVQRELASLRAVRPLHGGLNPELVLAVIDAELGGNALALSDANAIGLYAGHSHHFFRADRRGRSV